MSEQNIKARKVKRVSPEIRKREGKKLARRKSFKRYCPFKDGPLGGYCHLSRIMAGAPICIKTTPGKKIDEMKGCPLSKEGK